MKIYFGNCTCLGGTFINRMKDNARDITYKTFRANVDRKELDEILISLGYTDRMVLKFEDDYAVSFHKSKVGKAVVYYFTWSGIEYVFS